MRLLNWSLVMLLAALLAAGPMGGVPAYLRPDLFLILAFFAAARAPREEVLPLCWMAGLAKDLLSAGPLGQYALLYLGVGLVLAPMRGYVNLRVMFSQAVLALASALLTEGLGLMVLSVRTGVWPGSGALRTLLASSLVTGLSMPIAAALLDRSSGWLGLKRRSRFATAGFERVDQAEEAESS